MSEFTPAKNVQIAIPMAALQVVFNECDRYDADETGGRVLGTYEQKDGKLYIKVTGVIEPGPAAQRTATYFMQDGAYQERVFREIEDRDPQIEHLGNWHTHHVNGYPRLSSGDIATYRRIVEHQNHNTNFFYALLVVAKHPAADALQRYSFKNYVFRRGDPRIFEVDRKAVHIVESPLVWPPDSSAPEAPQRKQATQPQRAPAILTPEALAKNRVYDRDILTEFYPGVKTFRSKQLGIYWRGPLEFVDGSSAEVVVVEDSEAKAPTYTVALRNTAPALEKVAIAISERTFGSVREGFIAAERACNRVIYENRR